eukprot:1144614-Pelagomonas_calceolata.AAC.10
MPQASHQVLDVLGFQGILDCACATLCCQSEILEKVRAPVDMLQWLATLRSCHSSTVAFNLGEERQSVAQCKNDSIPDF